MSDSEHRTAIPPRRLCSEIQLFDLCDLASCRHKSDRYCTDQDLLDRFEKITERELTVSDRFLSDDEDESDMDEDYDYADDDETSDDAQDQDESDFREYDE